MELEQLSDVGTDFYPIVRELGMKGRGWLEYRNLIVRITAQGIIAAEELLKMQMAEKDRLVFTKDLRFRWSNSHGPCTNRHVENRTRDAISRAERNPPRLRTKEGLGYGRSKGLPFLIR